MTTLADRQIAAAYSESDQKKILYYTILYLGLTDTTILWHMSNSEPVKTIQHLFHDKTSQTVHENKAYGIYLLIT